MIRPPAQVIMRPDVDAQRDLDQRLSKVAQTEFGLAERFQIRYGERFRWIEAWNKWLFFNGKQWVRDNSAARRYAHSTILALRREASQIGPTHE